MKNRVASDQAPWLRTTATGVVVLVHIQPGAKRTEIVGPHGDALKLRLAAPPVDGRANAALLDYLAKTLRVSRPSIRLVSGEAARRKRLEIDGVAAAEVLHRLQSGDPDQAA